MRQKKKLNLLVFGYVSDPLCIELFSAAFNKLFRFCILSSLVQRSVIIADKTVDANISINAITALSRYQPYSLLC